MVTCVSVYVCVEKSLIMRVSKIKVVSMLHLFTSVTLQNMT